MTPIRLPRCAVLAFVLIVLLVIPYSAPTATARAMASGPYFVVPNPNIFIHSCEQTDPCALQRAVNLASSGDIIYLAGGTYTSSASQVLDLNKSVQVLGGWSGGIGRLVVLPAVYPTYLDGQSARRVIVISGNVSPTLNGLTIRNGNTADSGGGVYINNATGGAVTIDNCIIHNNQTAGFGGGVYLANGALTVSHSKIYNNSTAYGGGAFFASQDTALVLESSVAYGNTSDYGDLVHADRASLTLRGNFIHDHHNTAYNPSLISYNSKAGLHVIFENNIFAANDGGIFYSAAVDVNFFHNTLVNNGSDGFYLPDTGNTGYIMNNIITGQAGKSISVGAGSTVTIDHNLLWQNGENTTPGSWTFLVNPLLTADYHLSKTSPAIDAAFPLNIMVDYDGNARPMGRASDIGADESFLYLHLPAIIR